jgi:hypothetical protein
MKLSKLIFFSSLLILGFSSCSSDDDNSSSSENYSATLAQLNSSGADGTVDVILDGNNLTVNVEASGLVADQPHPQHIHGKADGSNGTCPPASADADDNGIITVPEGAPFYGAILLPLADFPVADEDGNISYNRTFTLGENGMPSADDLATLENRVIVLHGLNNEGSYVATIPVACGELTKN